MINRMLFPRSAVENAMFRLAESLEKLGHEIIWFVRDHEDNLALENSYAAPVRAPGEENRLRTAWRTVSDSDIAVCLDALIEHEHPDAAFIFAIHRTLTWSCMDVLDHWKVPTYAPVLDYTYLCPARTMTRDDLECRQCLRGTFLPCILHRCLDGDFARSLIGAFEARYLRLTKRYDLPAQYLVPSTYHKKLLEQSGFTSSPIAAVDLPLPAEAFKRQERQKRGRYFLCVGTLSERKGLETILRAMTQCVTDAHLMVVGNGRDEAALKRLCYELGLNDRVEFVGQVPGKSVRQLMAQCLCLIAPSMCEEIGPWALLEAQALGKPAIVSDYGVLPERIIPGKTGCVFPAGDSLALAQCLDEMIEMPDEDYDAMCRAARTDARKRYHPDNYAKRIMKIVERTNPGHLWDDIESMPDRDDDVPEGEAE